jgi:hypothetical protein
MRPRSAREVRTAISPVAKRREQERAWRRLVHISFPFGLLALGACASSIRVDPAAMADLQRCGLDIEFSSSQRLRFTADARDGSLSYKFLNEVRTTIFNQVPDVDRRAVYESYVACVTSRDALEKSLADLERRRRLVIASLREKYSVSAPESSRLDELYAREAQQLRTGELVSARSTRGQLVYEVAKLIAKYNVDPEFLIGVSGGPDPTQADRERAALSQFRRTCRQAADDLLCRSMEPVFKANMEID